MRFGQHIPQTLRIAFMCVALCWTITSMGCALKGFECLTQQDCAKAQVCQSGWCRTPVAPTPSGCQQGESRPCPDASSIFAICKQGTQQCQLDGTWGSCEGVVLSQAETCNKIDDNCNGEIDEGLDCACETGQQRTCEVAFPTRGSCRPGIQACDGDNQWGPCQDQVKPSTETCNGQDDDCNGQTDEDTQGTALSRPCFDGPAGAQSKGRCKAGTQRCIAGKWQLTCLGQQLPTPELCNGIDDDCNGQIDETCKPCVPNRWLGHIGEPFDHQADHVAWSANGKVLIAASNTGTLQLWEYPQNKYLRSMQTHGPLAPGRPLLTSQDGRYVAVALHNQDIEIWTLPQGTRHATLRGHQDAVDAMVFHPDGKHLISLSGAAHELRIWSLATGLLHKRITTNPTYRWDQLAISPIGNRLATASQQHAIIGIWEFEAEQVAQIYEGCDDGHSSILFRSTDQVSTLCQGKDGQHARLEHWSLSNNQRISSVPLPFYHVEGASMFNHPNQKSALALIFPSNTNVPLVLDVDTAQVLQALDLPRQEPGTRPFIALALNPVHEFVLGSSGNSYLWLWRIGERQPAGSLTQEVIRHHKAIFSLAVHPQGHQLASSSLQEQAIRIWQIQPGTPTFGQESVELQSASGAGGLLAFSPDGKWLASTDIYQQIVLWNTETHSVHATLSKHGNTITQLLFSPDGTKLISVSRTGETAILWEIPAGRFVRYISHLPVQSIAFHPNGKDLAISQKQHIEIVPLAAPAPSDRPSLRLSAPDSLLWLLFHPKGDRLLFANETLQSWTWASSTKATFLSQIEPKAHLSLHPSGNILAIGQETQQSIAFVQPLTGAAIGALTPGTSVPEITTFTFGTTPTQFLTGHTNGWVQSWDCPVGGTP